MSHTIRFYGGPADGHTIRDIQLDETLYAEITLNGLICTLILGKPTPGMVAYRHTKSLTSDGAHRYEVAR